jgi:hypothetical protein
MGLMKGRYRSQNKNPPFTPRVTPLPQTQSVSPGFETEAIEENGESGRNLPKAQNVRHRVTFSQMGGGRTPGRARNVEQWAQARGVGAV